MFDPFHTPSGSAPNGTVANHIFKGGGAPTSAVDSNVPEVRIEIQEIIDGELHLSRQITVRVADDMTAMIVNQTLGLGAQVVGAAMAVTLGSSAWKWPLYMVELSVIIWLTFTYAAISLRRRRPGVSVVMAKIGAIATAVAIIISAASHLPPPLGFSVTPFAVLVVSVAVVYA